MFLSILAHTLAVALLTVLTQVGGVVYLLALLVGRRLRRRYRLLTFAGGYLAVTLLVVPLLAPRLGRVALPISGALRPLTAWTCLLNRHYVRPRLRDAAAAVAEEVRRDFPGTTTHYLDANFPFADGFPLWPHRSHSDGRRLDLAFYYTRDGMATDEAPSVIGYGASLAPEAGEVDYATICTERGYWPYALMSRWYEAVAGGSALRVDEAKTAAMVRSWLRGAGLRKLFVEPHLKARWGLDGEEKVRFHGCAAVRHDDHVHVEGW